jgi:hypothetical protein
MKRHNDCHEHGTRSPTELQFHQNKKENEAHAISNTAFGKMQNQAN